MKVSVERVVVVRKYAGPESKFNGAEHRIVNIEDILGVTE